MNCYVLPDFLSAAECDAARALFPPPAPAVVNAVSGHVARRPIRSGRVSWLAPSTPAASELVAKIYAVLLRANQAFHFDIGGTEAFQLAEYREGDGYGWHLDIGPGDAARRKLSATIQLSDPVDYDGGDLEIWGAPPCDRARGSVVVFPSYLLHRVAPVTRGTRYSLVAWASGQTAFR